MGELLPLNARLPHNIEQATLRYEVDPEGLVPDLVEEDDHFIVLVALDPAFPHSLWTTRLLMGNGSLLSSSSTTALASQLSQYPQRASNSSPK